MPDFRRDYQVKSFESDCLRMEIVTWLDRWGAKGYRLIKAFPEDRGMGVGIVGTYIMERVVNPDDVVD